MNTKELNLALLTLSKTLNNQKSTNKELINSNKFYEDKLGKMKKIIEEKKSKILQLKCRKRLADNPVKTIFFDLKLIDNKVDLVQSKLDQFSTTEEEINFLEVYNKKK